MIQNAKYFKDTLMINLDIVRENLIRLSVTSMSLQVLEKLRLHNFPMHYTDPVYSRVRLLLEMKDD